MLLFALPFGVALVTALVSTPLSRWLARTVQVVAVPKDDRWHRGAVPLFGGVAIWVAALAGALSFGIPAPRVLLVLGTGTAMFLLGLVDDVWQLKPASKLLGQIAIACAAVVLGARAEWTGFPTLDSSITVLWVVGLTNAFNLLDNMDGLCSGVTAIGAIALCLSLDAGHTGVLVTAAALAGAAVGFLVFNFNPASVFLGDAGSLFAGSSLALLGLLGEPGGQRGVVSALVVPVLVLLIPIFDTTFVTLSRKLSARAASRGGKDHTSHRLVALGFSERQAVLVLYFLAAAGGLTAVSVDRAGMREAGIVLVLLLLALVLLGIQLARVKVYDGADFVLLRNRAFTPLLLDVTYKRRVFEVLLDFCLVTVAYYSAYVLRFDQDFPKYYRVYLTSLPIVVGCQLASFLFAGVYRGVWSYIGLADLAVFAKGVILGTVTSVMAVLYLYRFEDYSRGVFIIYAMTLTFLVVGSRLSFRVVAEMANRHRSRQQRALIYGAGEGGVVVVRELRNNRRYDLQPMGFLDDDPNKLQKKISGLPVLGAATDLERVIERWRPDVLIISSQKIPATTRTHIQRVCQEAGTRVFELDFRLTAVGSARGTLPR